MKNIHWVLFLYAVLMLGSMVLASMMEENIEELETCLFQNKSCEEIFVLLMDQTTTNTGLHLANFIIFVLILLFSFVDNSWCYRDICTRDTYQEIVVSGSTPKNYSEA
jgi:hypothetical protein